MFRLAIERPIVLAVAVLVICVLGIAAIFKVPTQMIPDLDPRVVTIETRWPGATPQDMEKEILIEQERFLRALPDLDRMVSFAETGRAEIELRFSASIDINDALIRVNNALAQVPVYPENVDEPAVSATSFSENAFMFFSLAADGEAPAAIDIFSERDWVEEVVAPRIERAGGVSRVVLSGGANRQIRIYVDPAALAERGISLIDVREAIRKRNRDVSGGDLDAGNRRYLLRTIGRFADVDELNSLVIASSGGAFVRLGDVGYAELAASELRSYSYDRLNEVLSLAVYRQPGTNVIEVMDNVVAAADELNEGVLNQRGLVLNLRSEDVRYVKDSIRTVSTNLIVGAMLATLVLMLFLRSWQATLAGAMGIPICTIAAFLGLLLLDRTINVISLAGVAFAIGMTLDNSIVVLENISRHVARGQDRRTAALEGVREVWPAVLASTLTTVFVFVPILFVELEAGQLYSDIAVAIAASIVMSLAISITLVPAYCSRFLSQRADAMTGTTILKAVDAGSARFAGRIMPFVGWILERQSRRLATVATTLVGVVAIALLLLPEAEYLPEGEEAKIFAQLIAPPGYNLERMNEIAQRIGPEFAREAGVSDERFDSGETDIPPLADSRTWVNPGLVFFLQEARHRDQIDDLIAALSTRLRDEAGMRHFIARGSIFSSQDGGTRSVNLELAAPDLEELFAVASDVLRSASELWPDAQIRSVPGSLSLAQPMVQVRPDWERAAELGIDTSDLGYTVCAYSDGAFVDEFFIGDTKVDMHLYSTAGTIEQPQDIRHLMLYSESGGAVPLSAVADVVETVNTETLRRVNGRRTVTISIVPPRGVALETAVATVRDDVIAPLRASGALPRHVNLDISGAVDSLNATRDALLGNFVLAVAIVYLLLVAVFSHWGYPLVIMTTVPIGICGGVVGLVLLNGIGGQLDLLGFDEVRQPFDVITMLGFLILIGTVVNNPILLVERSLANLRDGAASVGDAVLEATRTRLRPIMMTTITTVVGLSPLVFNPGAGTELYRGIGAVVMFGLLFSTLVTLTFMPALLASILEVTRSRPVWERHPAAIER